MYWICAAVSFLSVLLLLPVSETRGADLKDKLETETNSKDNNDALNARYELLHK